GRPYAAAGPGTRCCSRVLRLRRVVPADLAGDLGVLARVEALGGRLLAADLREQSGDRIHDALGRLAEHHGVERLAVEVGEVHGRASDHGLQLAREGLEELAVARDQVLRAP